MDAARPGRLRVPVRGGAARGVRDEILGVIATARELRRAEVDRAQNAIRAEQERQIARARRHRWIFASLLAVYLGLTLLHVAGVRVLPPWEARRSEVESEAMLRMALCFGAMRVERNRRQEGRLPSEAEALVLLGSGPWLYARLEADEYELTLVDDGMSVAYRSSTPFDDFFRGELAVLKQEAVQ